MVGEFDICFGACNSIKNLQKTGPGAKGGFIAALNNVCDGDKNRMDVLLHRRVFPMPGELESLVHRSEKGLSLLLCAIQLARNDIVEFLVEEKDKRSKRHKVGVDLTANDNTCKHVGGTVLRPLLFALFLCYKADTNTFWRPND